MTGCIYFSMSRSAMTAVATGQLNFFDGSAEVLYVPDRQKRTCEHKSAMPRRVGNAVLLLCKCHHTRLKKQYRKKRLSQRQVLRKANGLPGSKPFAERREPAINQAGSLPVST